MAYGSKTLSRKLQALHIAAHRALKLAPAVGEAFERKLRPELPPGETMPNIGLVVELISRELARVGKNLDYLHQQHHHAMTVEKQARAVQREAATQLRDALVDLRHLFDNHSGNRQGVADFEGCEDLQRIPMLSLPGIAKRLLAIVDDPVFGWHDYRDPRQVFFVRQRLAERLEAYRRADESCRNSCTERKAAAALATRGYEIDEKHIVQLYGSLEKIFSAAGFTAVARQLRPKRPATVRRRSEPGAESPASPT